MVFKKLLIILALLLPITAFAQMTTQQGGTGTTSPSGILYGDGTLHLKTVNIGSNLTFSGGTLSASGGGSSSFGTTSLTAIWPILYTVSSSLAQLSFGGLGTSSPISAGSGLLYATGVNTLASVSTSSPISMSITGNSGTVTNGVYTTTFNGLFDNRLSATTSLPNIITLAGLSLPYSQLTGAPTVYGYPFPNNATTTALTFSNGATIGSNLTLSAFTGTFCLHEVNGVVGVTASDCGSGGGGGITTLTLGGGLDGATPITTTGNIIAQVGTSTVPSISGLAYWTGAATPSTLGTVATTTLTASGVMSLSNPISVIGGSASVLTLTGGTAGQILAWSGGIPTWVATTTFNSPLTYANGSVSCASCLTANQTITLSGVVTGSGATSITTAFGNASAGTVLDNPTGNTGAPSFNATSTFFGTGTGGFVLSWNNGLPQWVATSSINNGVTSVATNNGLTGGTITTTGTIGLATINAGVLGTPVSGVIPTSQATSTLYGTGAGGTHLVWNNGVPQWVATTTFSAPLVFAGGNVTCNVASGSQAGCLSSTDWTTFNNKGSGSVTSVATNNGLTGGTITTSGTIGLASISQGILGNNGAASAVPTSISTTTLYSGTAGQVLSFINGGWTGVATTTFNSPLTYSNGSVSCASCLTANQTITLSGVVTGSGSTAITTSFGSQTAGVLGSVVTGNTVVLATSTLFGTGTGGQLLTWNNGVPQWVASTTYANGAGISTAFAGNTLTITNTGVTSIVAGTNVTISGSTGAVTINSTGGSSFTGAANSIVGTNAAGAEIATTSDPLWVTSLISTSTTHTSGFGTSSPWGLVSIAPSGAAQTKPEFVVASSTAGTDDFVIDSNGNAVFGTTTDSVENSENDIVSFNGFTGQDAFVTFQNWTVGHAMDLRVRAASLYDHFDIEASSAAWLVGTFGNTNFGIWDDSTTKASLFEIDQGAPADSLLLSSTGLAESKSTAPTVSLGAGAGSGSPVSSITGNANDFKFGLTTGSSPTGSNATIGTFTLSSSCPTATVPVYSDSNKNTDALAVASIVFASSTSANSFVLVSGATGLAATTVYNWNFHVGCY